MHPDPEDDAHGLSALIGARVRSERTAHGWTLDQLAERSGVSRRMVVNVEQGTSNASIATLLRLSGAFGVSLSALVAVDAESSVTVHLADDRQVLWRGQRGGEAVMVASTHAPDVVELWDWTLGAGDEYVSERHSAGTLELLHVLAGSVRMTVGDEVVDLVVGDAMSFSGGSPHAYANPGRRTARFALSVFQPGVGV
jgi:transcriptional regulator with XRE-family HTH domain